MKINKFTGQYKFLSNFYIISQGKTAEHVYMASKTIDPKEREAIFDCKTAAQAKRLGRKVTLRPNWDRLKLPFMEKIIRWKFSHKHLADMLIATGDDELIEGNYWHDYYWGVCNGKGENNLGKLLMKIREELK